MPLEAWLPKGHRLPDGKKTKRTLQEGKDWQIVETNDMGFALLALPGLASRWIDSGLMEENAFQPLKFGKQQYLVCWSSSDHTLAPIAQSRSPRQVSEALAFALALKATRAIDGESPLQDGIYAERYGRLLPTYSISARTTDDVVLGFWLTGGANVSAKSFRRLQQILSWMEPDDLKRTVEAAGFAVSEIIPSSQRKRGQETDKSELASKQEIPQEEQGAPKSFKLPGRPQLEAFFNEHVIDIINNQARYEAFGIKFPAAIVLHGPPGCGKTFAIERLVDYLGWPSFQIEASTVASPYIHETSKKVAAIFEKAMESAPSVLIIDEMEAFLADRQMGAGSSHHRVEEVGEFLRRIPEAGKNNVLVVAMTNRIEMIDPAILRRGRFDHVINVDMASEAEIRALLGKLLSEVPAAQDIDPRPIAKQLAGRPLSDVTFTVREAARLAVRAGKAKLDQASLNQALGGTPARTTTEDEAIRRIGFV